MTTAFEELLSRSSLESFQKFRKNLINNRGNFSNGNFAKCMDVLLDKENNNSIKKIIVRKSSGTDGEGFCFNNNGTTKAIDSIRNDSPLKLSGDISNFFLFDNSEKENLWKQTEDKKSLIALNFGYLVKKTDMKYKTLGDRCHYFVVGKLIIKEKAETAHFPLFLFPCEEVDEKKQSIKVDEVGFINFWVDANKLQNTMHDKIGNKIVIDDSFQSELINIQYHLDSLTIPFLDIKCDCTFSAISIVTGFEAEYLDPAWDKILK
ncbi:MAG: hypothetical protein LBS61_01560 [Endomicrobium sp.]|jgi:hypothetical protein|nr:hypothetical protein [Endomicrobium sp.]